MKNRAMFLSLIVICVQWSQAAEQRCNGKLVPHFENGVPSGYVCVGELNGNAGNLRLGPTLRSKKMDISSDDPYSPIYRKLHLHHGDLLLAANQVDFQSQEFFPTILKGYKDGNLCIKFRRDEGMRETCYFRAGTKEDIKEKLE